MLAMNFTVRAGFNAKDYLKHAWGIIKGEMVPAKVLFSRSVARYIRDRQWHPSQQFRELPDGRLEMTLKWPVYSRIRQSAQATGATRKRTSGHGWSPAMSALEFQWRTGSSEAH